MTSAAPVTVLHTGDEHIDSDRHGSWDPAAGRNSAWTSNYAVVRHLAETAVERRVSAFVSAGDAFMDGRPSQEALLLLADAYTPVAEAGIPIVILDGNHNRIGVPAEHRSAIWALTEILRSRRATVVASARPELVDLGAVRVATLPWLNPAAVLEQTGSAGLAPAAADRHVAQFATDTLARLADTAPDDGVPLIMSGHVTVANGRRGAERELAHLFSEPVLDVDALEQLPYVYGALGHIHTPQPVGTGTYQYAGSPNRLTFTDEADEKGGNLVTITGGGVNVERVITPARRMRTIDLTSIDGTWEQLQEGTLVRVILDDGEQGIDPALLADITAAGARIVNTKRQVVARKKPQRAALAQTVTPVDALREWAVKNSKQDPDILITAAQKLEA